MVSCEEEHALGLPLVPRPRQALPRCLVPPVKLVQALRDAPTVDGYVQVGTDGAVWRSSDAIFRCASWGIAFDAREDRVSFHGPVEGIDQSTLAAETTAALVLLHAAQLANVKVYIIIDNLAVQKRIDLLATGGNPGVPRESPALFADVKNAVANAPCRAAWCTSHEKEREITVPSGFTEARMRDLNSRADTAAEQAAATKWRVARVQAYEATNRASRRASVTLHRLQSSETHHMTTLLPREPPRRVPTL